MRILMTHIYLLWFIPLLCGSTCLTIDPPYPKRLSAPVITGHEIITRMLDNELRETIHLQWTPDSTDTISISSYTILRKTRQDSNPIPIFNIPQNVNDFYDPAYLLNFEDRSVDQNIEYVIVAVDSLERYGDTSAIYTVVLAQSVELTSPSDTLTVNQFRWVIPQIVNQMNCFMHLWKNDSCIWVSDTIKDFTGGVPKNIVRSLPDTFFPLHAGNYFWGVTLIIISGSSATEPTSITLQSVYVK